MKAKKGLFAGLITASMLTVASSGYAEQKIKNVILMIGDGMGPQQVGLLESYARLAPHSIYKDKQGKTAITRMAEEGVVGLSMTYPAGGVVVDSACSATQLSLGVLAGSEMIGLDDQGNVVETVLEKAQKLGKATGLVSDTRLTHATPASFAAHQPHRSLENKIAVDMLNVGPDVMLSGGLRHWIPASVNADDVSKQSIAKLVGKNVAIKSKRKDERNLLLEAQKKGYQLTFDRDQLSKVKEGKVLGLFSNSGMMDGIAYTHNKESKQRHEPSLKEMTTKAIDVLSKDKDGFFLMVEGGQIDWAGHNNDVGTMLHEMIKFDEAIGAVLEWAKGRDDTLVVLTADHETGSFGFSYSANNLPKPKKLPGAGFKDTDYAPFFNFAKRSVLDDIYGQNKTFGDMIADYQALPKAKQTPAELAKIISDSTGFKVTEDQAKAILADQPNPFYAKGHDYLGAKTLPKVNDFTAFYVYGEEIRYNLIGRALSQQQNVVWGTGTHTHTPVAVFAYGPKDVTRNFSLLQHHADVGQKLKAALQ
ncbi:alkaline phosphatase [Zooshikella sp. RANM57]|uniref:alkaline phosphatase n=1 Tax=Zooshikella sp. RANM57 TaxID=3425863 RepID=UPI003D6E969F